MIAWIVISAGIAYFLSLPFASLMQGANYRLDVYFRRAKKGLVICGVYFLASFVAALLVYSFCIGLLRVALYGVLYLSTGCFTYAIHKRMRLHLTMTNRLARLLILLILLYAAIFFPLYYASLNALWSVLPALSPFVLAVAALLSSPFEKINNNRYLSRAKTLLDQTKAVKIGITGSYGKTSVKSDLEQLLSSSFHTLATPANYNTPLGIAKTMGSSEGKEEIILLEMGARRTGDIIELCRMTTPTIGVITGIAPQHLETFGSLERIVEEKNQLARAISPENTVYYNIEDDRVRRLYDERVGKKVGIGFERADRLIENMVVTDGGTRFDLVDGETRRTLSAPLYGKAAITDLAIACAIALDLGVPFDRLSEKVGRLVAPPHRFEVTSSGGVTIIDDSYNINPIGAASALESISLFQAKRRIVYASGIVELGADTERENRALGAKIAAACDLAIIAGGKYGDLVTQGILSAQPSFSVIRVEDTVEATASFRQLLREGDLLLIMSDLPRDYLI